MEQIGHVDKVFLRGKMVVEDGKYTGSKGDGIFLPRKPYGTMYR